MCEGIDSEVKKTKKNSREQDTDLNLGGVVRKTVNTYPGLKVNRSIDFSCIKMFFTAYVFCSL